jgi:two-component system alkaline phosphatase synthesis response regulator PhoP
MATILVVDDSPSCREPIAASLRLAGFKTLCAGNGQEALSILQNERPDLILLDIAMPVMDGITTLQKIRAIPEFVNLPVIMLTAATEQRYIDQAGPLRPADYMLKSHFSLRDLVARVKRHLPTPATA